MRMRWKMGEPGGSDSLMSVSARGEHWPPVLGGVDRCDFTSY